MRLETKTVSILLCAALALSACSKKTITPAEDPQPAEVGFTASSQAVWVKGGSNVTETPEFPYDDFGVWGIARQNDLVYNLWGNDALMEVTKNEVNSYVPSEAAFWVKGYTYNFLAVAPYNDEGFDFGAVTTEESQTAVDNPSDYMSFTYDISSKYDAGNYIFDLLGAADQNEVTTGGYSTPQNLTFWHLLSQIEITNIGFASGISGEIDKITLRALPSAEYTLSYDNDAANLTKPTGVSCSAITQKANGNPADKFEIIFENPNFSTAHPIVNIIPQAVANLELYIDFTITDGTIADEYTDFKINLNAQELTEYVYNGKYKWNITIGTRNSITFDVSVTDWEDVDVSDEYPLS